MASALWIDLDQPAQSVQTDPGRHSPSQGGGRDQRYRVMIPGTENPQVSIRFSLRGILRLIQVDTLRNVCFLAGRLIYSQTEKRHCIGFVNSTHQGNVNYHYDVIHGYKNPLAKVQHNWNSSFFRISTWLIIQIYIQIFNDVSSALLFFLNSTISPYITQFVLVLIFAGNGCCDEHSSRLNVALSFLNFNLFFYLN